MGVPALFRWLSQKYPKIISPVVEDLPLEVDGQEVPVNTLSPNPNGEEFDNLYLDMNAIVHPCSHPEDRPPPNNEEEMMLAIFKYTDRVVNMVRPRKLLMLAVDGVAPRAKMNQQRSRRFRSAKEAKEKDEDNEEFERMLKASKRSQFSEETQIVKEKKTWDTNVITPGTPFMNTLAQCLRYWCAFKINTDPAWEKIKVIISDASVPGEGEHKIMGFIRSQRSSPEHDPNTRHVMYGLDADLIMLGLATHEPYFRVLREDVFFQESRARTCRICGQTGHIADECRGDARKKEGEFDEKNNAVSLKPFIWLHVSILREYLAVELHVPEQLFRFDLERALDDWVFMCFFVGNDFLPHLPSLDIRENGIDTLISIWRNNLPLMGGYVTKDGDVNLQRAQYILDGLAKQEDSIFWRRRQAEERKESNAKRRKLEDQNRNGNRLSGMGTNGGGSRRRKSPDYGGPSSKNSGRIDSLGLASSSQGLPLFAPGKGEISKEVREMTHEMAVNRGAVFKANIANKNAAAALKDQLLGHTNDGATDQLSSINDGVNDTRIANTPMTDYADDHPMSTLGKRKADQLADADSSTPGRTTPDSANTKVDTAVPAPDNVRLWESGYADRYYEQKFGADPKDIAFRNRVARDYVEGLAWVLHYYSQGCPSWTWYYPHHYAPFAADFVDLDRIGAIRFEKGIPFKPYEQLMGVLPATSNHAIPEVFRGLMTNEGSDILDFYPKEFVVDLNGKKFEWQGVALLPFIDAKRLLKAMDEKYPLLSSEEAARNENGRDMLIISDRHPLYEGIASKFYSKRQGEPIYKLDSKLSEGLIGKVEKNPEYIPQSSLVFPFAQRGMPDIDEDHSISLYYEMPRSEYAHKSMLLRGIKWPAPALDRSDIEATKARASHSGRARGGSFRGSGRGRGAHNNSDSRPNPFAAYVNQGPALSGTVGPSYRGHNSPALGNWAPTPAGFQELQRGPQPPGNQGYAPSGRHYGYAPPNPPPPPMKGYDYRQSR